ncbi:flagellar protein FlaG [Lysinibacillus sp. 1P01SD]|uniref:flagellar protein FlaG n=1 Tax=Lysinibacillus sp. 1P01SD TaxID=3132285 RepID=UPI00399F84EE
MRITENVNMEAVATNKSIFNNIPTVAKQESITTEKIPVANVEQIKFENNDEMRVKVQEAVKKMNEMLEVNNSASKFKYHEGLERYYVTVVNKDTDEVVKEIPPKKLLDAFYEMQKMLGMIVDEKI